MEFNSKPTTSIEQSKKLLALGLKRETADCHYVNTSYTKEPEWELYFGVPNELFVKETPNRYIPAWSLGRLIELMPRTIVMHFPTGEAPDTPIEREAYALDILISDDSIAEAVSTIEWLVKEAYFNKDFLENKTIEK